MPLYFSSIKNSGIRYGYLFVFLLSLASCTTFTFIRNKPANKPYLVGTSIEVKGGNFTKIERQTLNQRLNGQLDDSATVKTKDKFFFLKYIISPPAYDSAYAGISSRNMQASMFHLGYYNAKISYVADTVNQKVKVKYVVEAGKPTLIDTVSYRLVKPDLQEKALQDREYALLKKDKPITKVAVLGEISRLVDSFRNNGYYKFTAAELRVRGDTTIEALTSVTDDPFEQLRLLAEAQQQRDSPKIKLAVVLIPPIDSSKLQKFYINRIYLLPDFRQGDKLSDSLDITERATRNFVLRYHEKLFRTGFLGRNISLRRGNLFKQNEYYNTLNSLTKTGVWQSVNIQVQEVPDSSDRVNLVIELIPNKKYSFQAALEASYSASSNSLNALSGNLFGLSGNLSLLNRNVGKEAIRVTHNIRAGVELNNNSRGSGNKLINSNELSYGLNGFVSRIVLPKNMADRINKRIKPASGETFGNLNLSYNNRLNLFNLQSVNFNLGWAGTSLKKNWRIAVKIPNVEFSYLFNESDSFKTILNDNPFLRYSYNTAFVLGMGVSASRVYNNPYHPLSLSRESSTKINLEGSGFPILKRYKRNFVKGDVEYKYSISYPKTALTFRIFGGIGVPLLGSDTNRTLPFFKQYFGGGSNSMRGWPIRGIGPGGRELIPFNSTKTIFNDRTGDMQLEANIEYRYDIARIIPNTLTLRGALFIDAGNIWNLRNTKADGSEDSAQFQIKNLYKQLGVSAGTGFRLDFNYFVLRLDLGFRFKRPERFYINDGWQAPPLGFDDIFKKIFSRGANDEYRKWRYENFNFTIGVSYPF